MAHRDDLEPLQKAMAAALQGLAQRGAPGALHTIWIKVCGAAMAGASRPVQFEKGVLTIETDSSAWLRALQSQSPELCKRLAGELSGISSLELHLRPGAR